MQQYFAINLFTKTKRAFQGRSKKVNRHTKFDNVEYVELPVEFKGSYECGVFFLYRKKEYKELLNILTQKAGS